MEDFYLYILQVNVGLAVFYVLYQLSFARDTFLGIRRLFLWTVFVLAFVYPAIVLPEMGSAPLQTVMADYAGWMMTVTAALPAEEGIVLGWQDWLAVAWAAGVVVLAVRLGIRFVRLCGMAHRGRRMEWQGVRVIVPEEETAPFSFFGWIFVNPSCFDAKVLAEIMAHEQAHVRQGHSADMLAGELLCILFWFNPAVWLLRKALRQNLEFLADREVVASGCNRKNYQYHLLRLSCPAAGLQIVNNFNVSLLKKRIIMMNKKRTSRIGLLKYALLLPVTGLLVLSANADTLAEMAETTVSRLVVGEKSGDVKGMVVDENGKPLQGVTVIIMNTTIGVVTDAEGHFSVPTDKPGTLCFTFVGREAKNVVFKPGDTGLKVTMPVANEQLEDLVVVGYSKQEAGKEPEEVFEVVEDMPRFPGESVHKYLAQMVKYPVKAMEAGEQGTVFVSFVIDKTGKVVEPKVVKGASEALDAEAIRVVKTMPDWTPGKQRGKTVNVHYTLPINFRLENPKTGVQQSMQDLRDALVIIDGKEMPKGFGMKSVTNFKSATILRDSAAIAIYGEKGKNGVIIMDTKDAVQTKVGKVAGLKTTSGSVQKLDNADFKSFFSGIGGVKKPLIIVDGKKMPADFNMGVLNTDVLKSVTVLKGEAAVAIYGKDAANGAVVVETE